jgi:hypothetical protein
MSKNRTNFWDFANEHPDIVFFISLIAIIGIVACVFAVTKNM